MKYAILSDIHANWQAWQAVRDDVAAQQADTVVCLGDIVGYGPRPAQVLEDVRRCCANFVQGNHDAAAAGLLDTSIFNADARRLIDWTRGQLDRGARHWLKAVPLQLDAEGMTFVHAETPAPSEFGYVDDADDARACFGACDATVIWVGHAHIPGVFTLDAGGAVAWNTGESFTCTPGARYLVNVGSVGDPRDGRSVASYCLYDTESGAVTFRSVEFDCVAFRRELEATGQGYLSWFLTRGVEAVPPKRTHDMTTAKAATLRVERVKRERIQITRSALQPRGAPAAAAAPKPAAKGKVPRAVISASVLALLAVGLAIQHAVSHRRPAARAPTATAVAWTAGSVALESNADAPALEAEQRRPGLVGYFFSSPKWTGLVAQVVTPVLDFDWHRQPPLPAMNPENFSVRWQGLLWSPAGGTYTLELQADDYAEVTLGKVQVLRGLRGGSVKVGLKADRYNPLQILYRQDKGDASIHLRWEGPTVPMQAVPAASLWHKIDDRWAMVWWFARTPEGWTAERDVTDLTCHAGCLEGMARGTAPWILWKCDTAEGLDIAGFGSCYLALQNGTEATRAAVVFATDTQPMSEQTRMLFPVRSQDSECRLYYVDLARNPNWRGRLTALRLELAVPADGQPVKGIFKIDHLRIGEAPNRGP